MSDLTIRETLFSRLLQAMTLTGLQLPLPHPPQSVRHRRRISRVLDMLRSIAFILIVLLVLFRLIGLTQRWMISQVLNQSYIIALLHCPACSRSVPSGSTM